MKKQLFILVAILGSSSLFAQNFQVGKNNTLPGYHPNKVFFADMNNDSYNDLIYGDRYYTNDKKGGFNTFSTSIPTNNSGWSVAIPGNFDGDSDIEIYQGGFNEYRFYENDGTGVLSQQSTGTLSNISSLWRTADFDGDGNLDILRQGRLQLGNGNGTFQTEVTINSASSIQDLIIDDVDGDSNLDIIYIYYTSIKTLLGVGDGTFTTVNGATLSGRTLRKGVATFLNNDANADLVVMETSAIIYYTSDGDGTFTQEDSIPITSPGNYNLLAYDFDGDNDDDILYFLRTQKELHIIENKGSLLFEKYPIAFDLGISNSSTNPIAIYKADLDNDATEEIIIVSKNGSPSSYSNTEFKVIHKDSNNLFDIPQKHNLKGIGLSDIVLADGDFNLDGNTDILMKITTDSIAIFLGDGEGSLTQDTTFNYSALSQYKIVTEDFNNDNAIDFAIATGVGVDLFLNDGAGVFTKSNISLSAATFIITADFNQDNKADLAYYASPNVIVELGNNDGTFSIGGSYDIGTSIDRLFAAKLNKDDFPDIIAGTFSSTIYYALNKKDGTFKPKERKFGFRDLQIADINNDTLDDLIGANSIRSSIQIWENTSTDSTFNYSSNSFSGSNPRLSSLNSEIVLADLINDGKMDMLYPNSAGRNQLTSTYDISTASQNLASDYYLGNPSSYYSTIYAVDLTGDSLPEVISKTVSSGLTTVAINNFESAPKPTTLPQIFDFINVTDSSYTVRWKRGNGESSQTAHSNFSFANEFSTVTISNDTISTKLNNTYPGVFYTFSVRECNGDNGLIRTCTGWVSDSVKTLKRDQEITINMPDTVVYNQNGISLIAQSNSDQPIIFEVVSTINDSILGNTLYVDSIGTYMIRAKQEANDSWNVATDQLFSVYVKKAPQTLFFQWPAVYGYTSDTIILNGTSTSDLDVSYLKILGPINVFGNQMTFDTLGQAEIWAMQGGNHLFESALTLMRPFTIVKRSVIINANNGFMPFTYDTISLRQRLNVSTTDNVTPTYTVITSNATVINNSDSILLTGTDLSDVTVNISFTGNDLYNPAVTVTRSLRFARGSQTITFDSIPDLKEDAGSYTLVASSTSRLDIFFQRLGNNVHLTNNTDNPLIIDGPGIAGVRASQSGNSLFQATSTVVRNFCVIPNDPDIKILDEFSAEVNVISKDNDRLTFTDKSQYGYILYLYNADTNFLSSDNNYRGNHPSLAADGIYYVKYRNGNNSEGICESGYVQFEVKRTTSIIENSTYSLLEMFPNPTTGVLTITIPTKGNTSIQIIDQLGKIVLEEETKNPTSIKLNLDHLQNGVYMVKATDGKNLFQNTIILNK